jgi:UDP-N-acetylglucosamine--N-acetylmuramyl-(pentapeptide) pyrophosphoryl-undecaprenol N-acetylglucosamine transferase
MRVIVSAGGTGGHIYPAIAIINKILEKEPNSEVLYIGTHNRMEKDIVPSYDINYMALTVTGFKRKLSFDNVNTVINFVKAINKAKKIIKDFKPDVVIGVGGYVTAPVIYAANKLKIKTFIHEQNSIPGLANRFLSRYADKIGVSLPNSINYFPKDKTIYTGNPRSEVAVKAKSGNKLKYDLSNDKQLVLIVMGSLGSKVMNNKLFKMLSLFNNKEYEVLYVTGKDYYEEVKNKKFPSNVKIEPYLEDILSIMKVSDLMITRTGASTISEITAIGLPCIVIPSPYVANNHQYKNALELVEENAAIMIEEKDLNGDILVRTIDKVLKNKDYYNQMSTNMKKLGVKDSASKIYEVLKDMIDRR